VSITVGGALENLPHFLAERCFHKIRVPLSARYSAYISSRAGDLCSALSRFITPFQPPRSVLRDRDNLILILHFLVVLSVPFGTHQGDRGNVSRVRSRPIGNFHVSCRFQARLSEKGTLGPGKAQQICGLNPGMTGDLTRFEMERKFPRQSR
jgi:hypothetical protein